MTILLLVVIGNEVKRVIILETIWKLGNELRRRVSSSTGTELDWRKSRGNYTWNSN